jgi:hypothetical protein
MASINVHDSKMVIQKFIHIVHILFLKVKIIMNANSTP